MINEEPKESEEVDPRNIFGEDLNDLINKLDEFNKKYRHMMECTLIVKENDEQSSPKIYISNHVYDTAVLVTEAYNHLYQNIMRGLTTHR